MLTRSSLPSAGAFLLVNCLLCRAYSMLRAASITHRNMLHGVLRAPQAFFESTPSGRVLNRFSKDVDAIDSHIPDNIDIWMRTFWYTLNVLLICCALTPMFLIVVAPLTLFYWWVQVNRTQSANSYMHVSVVSVCRSLSCYRKSGKSRVNACHNNKNKMNCLREGTAV